jgi:hypothetical protein
MKLLSAGKNWITIIGLLIASINFLMIIVLFLISTIFNKNDTNLGLFIYIILPGFLLLGLIMVPAGILISRKKRITKTPGEKKLLPAVDLNNPRSQKSFIAFTIATVIILFLTIMEPSRHII